MKHYILVSFRIRRIEVLQQNFNAQLFDEVFIWITAITCMQYAVYIGGMNADNWAVYKGDMNAENKSILKNQQINQHALLQ